MHRFWIRPLVLLIYLSFYGGAAWADMAEWKEDSGQHGSDDGEEEEEEEDDDESEGEGGDEDEEEDGDDHDGETGPVDEDYAIEESQDEGCMAAAVNPTTALSVGLGVALLFGLRRKEC